MKIGYCSIYKITIGFTIMPDFPFDLGGGGGGGGDLGTFNAEFAICNSLLTSLVQR